MGIPGPGGPEWAVALLAWASLAALTGELVRSLTARHVSLWRRPEPIERLLVDFYLGGAIVYAVAAVPWDGFVAPVVLGIPLVATALLVLRAVRAARRPGGTDSVLASLVPLGRPVYLAVLLSGLGLFLVELATALPVGSGNTFDSSLLTTYTSLLLRTHTTATSFAPYATTGILYPQGATTWLGWAQLLFGPPPARMALLVTPLFLGLAPLAGFAFGRRVFGTDRAGLATALLLAWVGTGTRGVVFGSNDFVIAFPLVLVLAGQAAVWLRAPVLAVPDALAFGVLAGYSAAINPVGAEWLFVTLPLAALLARPRFGGHVGRWAVRWGLAVGVALVAVVPSLYVLWLGRANPRLVPGAGPPVVGASTGISAPRFLGSIDPFLFGSQDTGLSSLAALRFEIAVLLVLGLAVVLLLRRDSTLGRYLETFRILLAAGMIVLLAYLTVFWAASTGWGPAVTFSRLSSSNELSLLLFTLYGVVAALPLMLSLERFAGWVRRASPPPAPGRPTNGSPGSSDPPRFSATRAVLPLLLALAIVVPGVVLTPTELPPSLNGVYQDFGNVTAADYDLLAYAGSHLPSGARVLVAPGSAGEFLPGYCSDIVLLYPMVPGWPTVNASYARLVRDLPNATFGPTDQQALASLDVGFVVVTGNNTQLWWAFSPTPFLRDPASYPVLFHEGDAYLFGVLP